MKNTLETKAVLASLTIRGWSGRKLDRRITDETNERYEAEADAGRFNKQIIDKKHFAEIRAARRAARILHETKTQPWLKFDRILPLEFVDEFCDRMRVLRTEYNDAAEEFSKKYPSYYAGASKKLGKEFNADDYPAPNDVRRRFSFSFGLVPWSTNVQDFRMDISKEILQDSERFLREALENTMKEPVRRIVDVVTKMSTRLKAYKPATKTSGAENKFRESLVTNIRELVELLPAFNLTGDAKLTELTNRMTKELCVHDANVLREDTVARKAVAKAAEEILKQANALMA